MSKISEQKAFEEYPLPKENPSSLISQETFDSAKRTGYIVGYDQAVKDIEKQVEESVIEKSNGEVTIEDLVAYNQGFKIGRELTIQDFLEKAERWLEIYMPFGEVSHELVYDCIQEFKNYMKDESEN